MTKTGTTERPAGSTSARRGARAHRLAAALKANLRRRKTQARERASQQEGPDRDTGPAGIESPGAHDSARVVTDKRPG